MHKLLLTYLFLIKLIPSFSQDPGVVVNDLILKYRNSTRDSNAVNLLLQIDSIYLYKMPDTNVILDSALLMAQQAKDLSKSIHFETGYENAVFMVGNSYAEMQNMPSAIAVMNGAQGKLRVRLLIMLAERYFFRLGGLKQNQDSAYSFVIMARDLSESLHCIPLFYNSLCLLGKYYFANGAFSKGRDCFMQIITDCHSKGNVKSEAHWWDELAVYMSYSDSTFREGIYYHTRAYTLYKQLHMTIEEPSILEDIASIYQLYNFLDSAIEKINAAIEIRRSLKQIKFYNQYVSLAKIYLAKGNNQKALYYGIAAANNVDSVGATESYGNIYFQLAESYRALNETDNSILWYKKSLANLFLTNRLIFPVFGRIVNELLKQARPGEALDFIETFLSENKPVRIEDKEAVAASKGNCYKALHQYGLAEQSYLRMIALDEEQQQLIKNTGITSKNNALEYSITGSEANYLIGLFYVEQNRYTIALPYLAKALSFKRAFAPSLSLQKDIHFLMFKVDSAAGNYLSAIRHFSIHKNLNDSIFNETKSKQIEELKIQYQTNEKENDLKLLQSKEQVQLKELQWSSRMRTFISLVATLLIILLIIGTSRYRLKQKSNLQLMTQQAEINSQYLELTKLNKAQEKLLEEKEWLVKEIHHRVKNNLQMIISLLNAQSEFLDHPSALNAIKESRERMQAVALIHQKLYQPAGQGAFINMLAYIQEMVNYIWSSFTDNERITFKLDIEDINLDVSQAVPLGLILNEAITNAVKYAFPSLQHGTVYILLHYLEDEKIILRIKDNGQGLPFNFDFSNNNSLGMQLMQLFAEQLEGDIEFTSPGGVEISLTFKQFQPEKKSNSLINTVQSDGKNSNS